MAYEEKAPPDIIKKLKALVDEHGMTGAVKKLQIGKQTIARALGGLKLRAGTRAILREKLQ